MKPTEPARPAATEEDRAAVAYLRSPEAIRERAAQVLEAGLAGSLAHFAVHQERIDAVTAYVVDVIRQSYPDLEIPYHSRWNHFRAGGVDRIAKLQAALTDRDPAERVRCLYDLVLTSVLLDAGAGPDWSYVDPDTGQTLTRSEGLAVASLHLFVAGALSDHPGDPYRADADALRRLDTELLAQHFQHTADNPLVGLSGRAVLLQRLGDALYGASHIFGSVDGRPPRIGGLFDYLNQHLRDNTLPARVILSAILEGLSSIWPGRMSIGDIPLGDVWPHRAAGGTGASAGLIPFHKLSQWLAYSLIEPLTALGIRVASVDALTGLAEYRNGGLFVDLGVLVPKHEEVIGHIHSADSEIIVEWRALTVALLDLVATPIRKQLGKSQAQLPLTSILEGGTWRAGRQIARELRPDGSPPIRVDSDGTVF